MKPENNIINAIFKFYADSGDFNGIPLDFLQKKSQMNMEELKTQLTYFIRESKITLTFSSVSLNPHIKRFPDLEIDEQISKLETEETRWICVYPSPQLLTSSVDTSNYETRPFTKRLLLGEAQLEPIYFDLQILENYHNDPRYYINHSDYSGSISVTDEHYLSNEMHERDKISLQTFGLGYKDNGDRVIVVFLRYLSDLTPEHQQIWNTKLLTDKCYFEPDYYRNSILGEFTENVSIYDAFLEEIYHINEISKLMEKPPLFRRNYKNERPKDVGRFWRPTLKNYNQFVHTLDKLLSENINKDFFRDDIPLEKRIRKKDGSIESRPKGTIKLLEEWLQSKFIPQEEDPLPIIIEPFTKIRSLRQKPAHSIQEDDYNKSYHHEQDNLIREAYRAVRTIRLIFISHPNARDYNVQDWLYDGKKIKIY